MRLADAIADSTPPPARPNKVDRLLAKIEHDDDRDEMLSMLMDPSWEHKKLATILGKVAGETVGESTVGEWRRSRGVR